MVVSPQYDMHDINLKLQGKEKGLYFFFKNYILLIMLLQWSWFFPSTQHTPLPQSTPTPLFMSMDHGFKFFGYSLSYTVLYIPWLFCNYLFILLNPLTSLSFPPHPSPIWHPSKCSPYQWFCLCSSLLSLFQLLIDMYLLPFYCS